MPKGRNTTILILLACVIGACQSHKTPPCHQGTASNVALSRLSAQYPPGLSWEAQMEVFYVDGMGRCPDKYDYLWYACKAVIFADQQVDQELRAFAERKATQYHLRWTSGHTNGLPDYWTRHSDTAKYGSKAFSELLGSHPKHAYRPDIQQAIQDLQEAEKERHNQVPEDTARKLADPQH